MKIYGPLITDLIDYTNNPRGDGYGIDLYQMVLHLVFIKKGLV
jgi:hypothetical protein